jgi:ribosome maturation factor RimP
MNEVRNILSDCEILIQWELELESEIIRRKLLLNEAYQKVISLEISIGKIEAYDNSQVYIGNIIKSHNQLDKYDRYHSISNLTEIMNEINLTNNFDVINNNDSSTNCLGSEISYYQEVLPK